MQKNEQNLTANISTMTKEIKEWLPTVVSDDVLGYKILCFEAKERCY